MLVKTATITLMLGCAAPAMAQVAPAASAQSTANAGVPKPATVTARELRFPIQMAESSLLVAVARGVESFAEQLRDVVPDLLVPVASGSSKAHGTVLDGYGLVFYLEVPAVRWTVIDTYRDLFTLPQGQGPNRPASVVVPNPVPSAPASSMDQRIAKSDAWQHSRPVYHRLMIDSLIDALLDSVVLPQPSTDTLAIWVRNEDPNEPNTTILSVKAGDLEAFRLKKLTREEMRKRIDVKEFLF
jgi:hypothetical protein